MKFSDRLMIEQYIKEAPIASKGWTMKSIEKFEKTIGKKADEHGFFDACVSRMKGKMGDQAKGFCAAIKDSRYGSPQWRGKGKEKSQIKKDVKKDMFKDQLKKESFKDRNGNTLNDGDNVMYGRERGEVYKSFIRMNDGTKYNKKNINRKLLLRIK